MSILYYFYKHNIECSLTQVYQSILKIQYTL